MLLFFYRCQCLTNTFPIEEIDHLAMYSENGRMVNCLCGSFRSEWLPVSLRTWSPVKLIYSVSYIVHLICLWSKISTAWNVNEYFLWCRWHTIRGARKDSHSGLLIALILTQFAVKKHLQHIQVMFIGLMYGFLNFIKYKCTFLGELSSNNFPTAFSLNSFYHQQCTWILDSKVERQLFVEVRKRFYILGSRTYVKFVTLNACLPFSTHSLQCKLNIFEILKIFWNRYRQSRAALVAPGTFHCTNIHHPKMIPHIQVYCYIFFVQGIDRRHTPCRGSLVRLLFGKTKLKTVFGHL